MAEKLILVDTSILIDYYRKTDKDNSRWIGLVREGFAFAISSITKYEIYAGATPMQLVFWEAVLEQITVIPFDENTANIAVRMNTELKKKRNQIDIADLFIASTAVFYNIPLATLNKRHFERIQDLTIM